MRPPTHVPDSAHQIPFRPLKVNHIQLIILALEGVVLCVLVTAWVWHLLSQVAGHRYSMYSVFIVSACLFRGGSSPCAAGGCSSTVWQL